MNDAPEKIWAEFSTGRFWIGGAVNKLQAYRRADLPATPAQIAASPEVRALVMLIRKCRPSVANMAYGWPEDAALVQEIDAALAAFKAMEAGG